jgi:hypothetical protein
MAFIHMTEDVKDFAQSIRDNKPTDMHPVMYEAVMEVAGFTEDPLLAALCHLIYHMAYGIFFVDMVAPHRIQEPSGQALLQLVYLC